MGRIEIVATEEDRVYASKRDWQCPDVPFAPIDKHHAISNLKICWSFFFSSSKSSLPPQSCVLKRALSETLRFFPLSRKVVDFPIIPSLSGREECGVYWKELDVLYHRSDDESDDDEPNEMAKMMERVQRETKSNAQTIAETIEQRTKQRSNINRKRDRNIDQKNGRTIDQT